MRIVVVFGAPDGQLRIDWNPRCAGKAPLDRRTELVKLDPSAYQKIEVLTEARRAVDQVQTGSALECQIARGPAARGHQRFERRDVQSPAKVVGLGLGQCSLWHPRYLSKDI